MSNVNTETTSNSEAKLDKNTTSNQSQNDSQSECLTIENPIDFLCKNSKITRIRSMHAIFDSVKNCYKTNMLAQIIDDSRWHWIEDEYSDPKIVKSLLEKTVELNWSCYPQDQNILDDWSTKIGIWSKAPEKGLSLFHIGNQ